MSTSFYLIERSPNFKFVPFVDLHFASIFSNGMAYEDWAFGNGRSRPTYPDGVAPIIPHPKFKNIISPDVEPLYTSIPVGKVRVRIRIHTVRLCCRFPAHYSYVTLL